MFVIYIRFLINVKNLFFRMHRHQLNIVNKQPQITVIQM